MKYLLIVLTLASSVQMAHGQKWKEKLNKLKGGKGESTSVAQTASLTDIAKKWETGKFMMWKPYSRGDGGMLEPINKVEIEFLKNGKGEVYEIKIGLETFEPYSYRGSDFIDAYFKNHMKVLYLSGDQIISYYLDKDYNVKGINHIYAKKSSIKAAMSEVQAYRDYRDDKLASDREAIAEAERENRAKHSLEGKEVTQIKTIYPNGEPDKFVSGTSFEVGYEITLSDGTTMKTKNIGGEAYVEDLKVTAKQNVSKGYGSIGSDYSTGEFGGYNAEKKISLTPSIKHDLQADNKLVFTVTSKFGGSGKATIEGYVYYSNKGSDHYNGGHRPQAGASKNGGKGFDGQDVLVQLKQVKHPKTGQDLHVYNCNGTNTIIAAGGTMVVNASGGTGQRGGDGEDKFEDNYDDPGDGGLGGTGGDGGNITLIIDPSVTITHNFEASTLGGNGGHGGFGGKCRSCPVNHAGEDALGGAAGSHGGFKEKKGKVNF